MKPGPGSPLCFRLPQILLPGSQGAVQGADEEVGWWAGSRPLSPLELPLPSLPHLLASSSFSPVFQHMVLVLLSVAVEAARLLSQISIRAFCDPSATLLQITCLDWESVLATFLGHSYTVSITLILPAVPFQGKSFLLCVSH